MSESDRLVLNRTPDRPFVLHRETCPSIQHQVRGDLGPPVQRGGFHILDSFDDGSTLVGPSAGVDQFPYEAVYVTVDDLTAVGRYRRCKVCVPDAPDGPPASQVNVKKAEALTATDVGRMTIDGPIATIEHSSAGTTVTLTTGTAIKYATGETVTFPKQPRIRG